MTTVWIIVLCVIAVLVTVGGAMASYYEDEYKKEHAYGPREILRWAVEKGWTYSFTRFDTYEGENFTKKEFDEITRKAEELGRERGLRYLQGVVNSRFYNFGEYY